MKSPFLFIASLQRDTLVIMNATSAVDSTHAFAHALYSFYLLGQS